MFFQKKMQNMEIIKDSMSILKMQKSSVMRTYSPLFFTSLSTFKKKSTQYSARVNESEY